MSRLPPGTLAASLERRSREALASGALLPFETDVVRLDDAGIRFVVRIARSLQRKAAASAEPARKDPFAPPYEAPLYVADVSDTHVCLLNKFNVFDRHALIVTRAFEDQEELLTPADFDALLRCSAELDALFFYNGGRVAGASQPHKHLQLVPCPLDVAGRTPVDEAVRRRALPFQAALDALPDDAQQAHRRYLRLLKDVGRAHRGAAYNLLATRDFLMVVPRTAEHAAGISINALGFAGSLFVKTAAELERVREIGPASMLREVTGGPDPG